VHPSEIARPRAGPGVASGAAMRTAAALAISLLVAASCSGQGGGAPPGGGGKADDLGAADAQPPPAGAREALVTCDFGSEIHTSEFILGTLEFHVDLDSKDVHTTCPKDAEVNCVLDGPEQDLTLMAVDTWDDQAPHFSADPATSNVRRIIITGGNGDDIELTVYVSYDPSDAGAVMVTNDGQFVTGVSDIATCTSVVL
jgi:hypothetical protein